MVLNHCSQCETGYAFTIIEDTIINTCLPTNDNECYIINANSECVICKENFHLVNGQCIYVNIEECSDINLTSNKILQLNVFPNASMPLLTNISSQNGCQKCPAKFHLLFQ